MDIFIASCQYLFAKNKFTVQRFALYITDKLMRMKVKVHVSEQCT